MSLSLPPKGSRGTRGLAAAALLVASSLVCVCAGELVAWRLLLPPPPPVPPPEAHGLPTLHSSVETWYTPNLRGVYEGVIYENNFHGFRGPHLPFDKPSGVFRLMLIGDSVSYGSGVSREVSYASRLEARLNEKLPEPPDRRYEVLNLSVPGFNLSASVRRLENQGVHFDPDLVVYGFTLNDLEGPGYRVLREPPRPRARSHLLELLRRRWGMLQEMLGARNSYAHELDWNYFQNPEAWQTFEEWLARLAEFGRGRGLCSVVFVHTHLFRLDDDHLFTRHYARVAEAAEAEGLTVVESLPQHAGLRAESLWVSAADVHPNADGHRVLGDALWEGLQGLPEHCWQGEPQANGRAAPARPGSALGSGPALPAGAEQDQGAADEQAGAGLGGEVGLDP